MANKKAVVTGGAGFIGSHIVDALLEQGYEVHVVDTYVAGKREDRINPSATYYEVDVRDTAALVPIFEGAQYVFHEAALPRVEYSIQNPEETFAINAGGTVSVLEAARRANVARVMLASSGSVYGDQDIFPYTEDMPVMPKSPYALQKYVSECALRLSAELYGVSTVSLRYFNVYGPRFDPEGPYGLVVGKFISQRKQDKPLMIAGDGTHTRDYVHVKDVARANILAAESVHAGHGEAINIGTGVETSVLDIATLVGGATEFMPPRIEPARSVAAISRAKELLDWKPTISFEDGVVALKKDFDVQ
jgi:UDP-glucose 4-epimerase